MDLGFGIQPMYWLSYIYCLPSSSLPTSNLDKASYTQPQLMLRKRSTCPNYYYYYYYHHHHHHHHHHLPSVT